MDGRLRVEGCKQEKTQDEEEARNRARWKWKWKSSMQREIRPIVQVTKSPGVVRCSWFWGSHPRQHGRSPSCSVASSPAVQEQGNSRNLPLETQGSQVECSVLWLAVFETSLTSYAFFSVGRRFFWIILDILRVLDLFRPDCRICFFVSFESLFLSRFQLHQSVIISVHFLVAWVGFLKGRW